MTKALWCLAFLAVPVAFAQAVSHSREQQIKFIEKELYPVIKAVALAEVPYPEVNDRIRRQNELIRKRFGEKKIRVNLRARYHQTDRRIHAITRIGERGEPEMILYIPALMDDRERNWASLLRKVMHERDHLTEIISNDKQSGVEDEIHLHGLTTEFVTRPLEKYVALSPSDRRYLDAWIDSGRNEKSPVWRDYMQSLLTPVLY